jgi:hypothetical protein
MVQIGTSSETTKGETMSLIPTQSQTLARSVKDIIRQNLTSLMRAAKVGYEYIWASPGVAPSDIILALGTDAEAVFSAAQLNIQTIIAACAIAGIDAPTIPSVPSNYTLTFNSDGSANVVIIPPADTLSGGAGAK